MTTSETAQPVDTMDLIGGALCLDFTNTASRRTAPDGPRERLHGYGDLVTWAERTGVLDDAAADRLRHEMEARPADARAALERARTLREAIYRVFSALEAGDEAVPHDLTTIEAALAEAHPHRRLERTGDHFEWVWVRSGDPLAWITGPVADSAIELLRSADLDRVKECSADHCNWLFLDASRNRSRRWCDMRDCGNRAKARRFYRRSRAEGTRGRDDEST